MSSIAHWSYTSVLTIWPVTVSEFGGAAYGTPYTLAGCWEAGGEVQTTDAGDQFTPKSTYYFEAEDGSALIPERQWFIVRGDHTASATPIASSERIQKVGGWDMSMFGADEIPDWVIYT